VRHVAGYALKAFAFFLSPIFIGLLVATWRGWSGLAASPRLLAAWAALVVFFFLMPLFLARAGRAAMGHEPREEARRVWRTGAAALLVGVMAVLLVPSWRDLGAWLSETLSNLTGIPVLTDGSAH
jgi:membrane-anchored protein YejM (alkaline phosphatase superfamily)